MDTAGTTKGNETFQSVEVQNVSKSYTRNGKSETILQQISFHVHHGEVVSILGQSGCGKSTLLSMIGGFEQADRGDVIFCGNVVQRPSRKCVMLFQHYGLLPWRSVLKNVELGLGELSLAGAERKRRALEYLKLVGLEDKAELFPRQLSGGMQQRVALARALVLEPELILMDEPFAALDTFTRYYLQDELLRIQRQQGTTVILVTHDIDEAVYLSDRVLLMKSNPGEIHKEIVIDLSKPRDRGNDDFHYYRNKILEHFHFHHPQESVDFSI